MTGDLAILTALFAAVLGLLMWGRLRHDLVAFGALVAGVLAGVVPAAEAFAGFGHPATVVVALVLILSAGLVRSGAVQLLTRPLLRGGRSVAGHIAAMGGIGAALSAVMNNVAALAMLMPADLAAAARAGRPPGRTLMALAFATILGGMVTLIGTPPNIVIASFREGATGTPFGMFDFAPVGGAVALAGLAFVALAGWRLVPDRGAPPGGSAALAGFVVELAVPEGSPSVGRPLGALAGAAEAADAAIVALVRGTRRLSGAARERELAAGDILLVEGAPEALDAFRAEAGLAFAAAPGGRAAEIGGGGRVLIELVVPAGARIIGKTAAAVGLDWRQDSLLMGIVRNGRTIGRRVRQTRVQEGDILLLLVPEDRREQVADWLGALPLAGREVSVLREDRAVLAIAAFAVAVAAAVLGLVALPAALAAVVVVYVLAGVLPAGEVYDRVDWPAVVMIGAMIPLGAALDAAGGTGLIAAGLLALTEGLPIWVALLLLMVGVMLLSDVLNNTATAILAAPVALRLAEGSGSSADPFLMAVAVGASCAFLTPIGHQNNMLVLGPGGYRFADYWRMGLPLEAVVVAVGLPAILIVWPP